MGFDFQENAAAGAQIFSSFSSALNEGTEFTISGIKVGNQVVTDDNGNAFILCVGHKMDGVSVADYEANPTAYKPKGYLHLVTNLNEDIGLASLFRATVGRDADGKTIALKPQGTAVAAISAAIATIQGPKTLDAVKTAILPVVTGKVLVCHTAELFKTSKTGFEYSKTIKSYDFK